MTDGVPAGETARGTPSVPESATGVGVAGVTKRYGEVVALDDVSVTVADGFHCLVGPNGSGKSTLFRLLLGLTRPTAGRVHGDADLGVAFQQPSFYGDLTVAENLDVFSGFVGASEAWRRTVVDRVELADARHRAAADLSAGYGKKLDLALALLKRPDVLLVDEPLADLDDVTKARLVGLLADYADEAAVLVATHNLATFQPVCDRLTVLVDGEVRLDAPREALPGDLSGAYLDQVDVDPGVVE